MEPPPEAQAERASESSGAESREHLSAEGGRPVYMIDALFYTSSVASQTIPSLSYNPRLPISDHTMAASLSSRDNLVLQSLFDSEAAPTPAAEAEKSPATTSLPHFTEHIFSAIERRERGVLQPLASGQQDSGVVGSVIQKLSELIDEYPQYASAYINRAQASRLLIDVDGLFSSDHASGSARIFDDLSRGIELATPSSPSGAVSAHQSKVLATAHTHRGFLLLKVADMVKNGQIVHGLNGLSSSNAASIEEIASEDFARGGRHGNALGKQMAVRTNPYAKMCGAIVKDALQQEIAAATSQYNHSSTKPIL